MHPDLRDDLKRAAFRLTKGKRDGMRRGCEKRVVQEGNEPWNKCPVGSEITDSSGYLRVKVAGAERLGVQAQDGMGKTSWQGSALGMS